LGRLILDVAHNAEAAAVLADNLRADGYAGRVVLALGMLADKPVSAVCAALAPLVRAAFFGSLPPPRGLDSERLRALAFEGGMVGVAAGSIEDAFEQAWRVAGPDDIVLVCGSFLSVAAIAKLKSSPQSKLGIAHERKI
ncbi:MAG: bifunctional tetrahydrofolate synthase/dihydrofolate synthase, partial [Nevskia sp.]|nr:bifunctional tetrahydrofolate synthase/dihydrofolate synthase [Nevskia sp.]